MGRLRQSKVDRIANSLPPLEVDDPSGAAKVLVLGWGSTYGPIGAGIRRVRKAGYNVAQVHLRHLNPFPNDLGEILKRYDQVLVPRSEQRRVGKECVSTLRSRWSRDQKKKKNQNKSMKK